MKIETKIIQNNTKFPSSFPIQLVQDYFALILKKDLPFTFLKLNRHSKAEKEPILEQILLSYSRMDTLKKREETKIRPTCFVRCCEKD